jgi:N-hydroxyarylamine O-acetyltransferase
MSAQISNDWMYRYLTLLAVDRAAPSLPALANLIRAQFRTVPFENVTSLLRRVAHLDGPVPPLDPEALLVNWERGRGGGVCYELSTMFHRLLTALGYDASLVLAQISFPGGHQAIQVALNGDLYLVDVGTGAPFFMPIPLDRTHEVHHAGLAYRFRPGDADQIWQQDRLIDGTWTPFCRYDLHPPDENERAAAYQRHHTFGETWVVDKLRLVKCTDEAVFTVTDNVLTRITEQGKRTEHLTDLASYQTLAAEIFHLPAFPIADAVAARAEFATISAAVLA